MENNLGNKETMAKNLRYYMDKRNINATELANALNFPLTTVSNWLHANTYPRIDRIEMMANYFGISKADLVEEEGPSKRNEYESVLYKNVPKFEAAHTELIALYSELTPEHKQTILEMLRLYASQDRTSE